MLFRLFTGSALLLTLSLSGACAPRPASLAALPPTIERIALLPVFFAGRAKDRYMEHRAGQEILWQSKRLLEIRGYRVITVADPSGGGWLAPFRPELANPGYFLDLAPEEADAVLLIRVEHFLDGALHSGGNSGSLGGGGEELEIHAAAEIIDRKNGTLLYSRYGIGRSLGAALAGVHEMRAAGDLAQALFYPLAHRGAVPKIAHDQ
ncbi:MAG: hypothetical protein RBT64_14070 [Trichloromonas sp.]|jgi:hypothetical protein|nr:hypothetical protein [Trichloromonas sp.]